MNEQQIAHAAALIREGRLVAFPTETVYGLGANALDPAAVRRIFKAKGRPSTSPLIVHVSSEAMAREYASDWPEAASALARRHWPGPLTLVVPKDARIPDDVTAGLGAVGLRVPAHPVALALIEAAGVPVAAPSANRFTGLSPTSAEHVRRGLGALVDCVLDGGSTPIGIESTVLSLAAPEPLLLRPGMITREEIEELIGPVRVADSVTGAHPSPGMHARHYSPKTPLVLVDPGGAVPSGDGVLLQRGSTMPSDARSYAAALYARLHHLDLQGLDWIAVEWPPDAPEWTGIRDRLRRAAATIPENPETNSEYLDNP
jgi:L-threonylcarbamoyladenylate synthase